MLQAMFDYIIRHCRAKTLKLSAKVVILVQQEFQQHIDRVIFDREQRDFIKLDKKQASAKNYI